MLYSLGNFVFGTPGRFTDHFPGYGLIATTHLDGGGVDSIELRCILTDNDRVAFQPRVCPAAEAAAVLGGLHPAIVVTGDVARLTLR